MGRGRALTQGNPPHHHHGKRAPGRDPVRHFLAATLLALVVVLVLPDSLGWAIQLAAAGVAALLMLLIMTWRVILHADAAATRRWAAREDPGSFGILFVVLSVSFASLGAAAFLLLQPERYAPGRAVLLEALGIIAVFSAWALMHTSFTFRYAHLYYREDGADGGLDFPGDEEPTDSDFAYFAFTIGMTFQTADVAISKRSMRRVVLLHALLTFLFNTAILALAVNLVFGQLT